MCLRISPSVHCFVVVFCMYVCGLVGDSFAMESSQDLVDVDVSLDNDNEDADSLNLDEMNVPELVERIQALDRSMLELGDNLHERRIELREERSAARLSSEQVAEINSQITELRREIERVVDEEPPVRDILDEIHEWEQQLAQMMAERRMILQRLQAAPHDEVDPSDVFGE